MSRGLLHRALDLLRRPSTVYLVASVLGRVGFLFLLPLYARKLTTSEYGTYSLAQTLITFSPTVLSLGGIASINKFFFAEADTATGLRAAGTVGRWTTALTLVNGAVVAGVVFAFRHQLARFFTPLELFWVVVAGVGSTLLALPSTILRCEQRAYTAAFFQFGELLAVAASGLLCVGILGHGLNGAIEALGWTYGIGGLVTIVFLVVYARGPWDRTLGWRALRFSISFVPHFVALWLQSVADRWTLKLAGDDAALGTYSLANQLASPAAMVVTAWNLDRAARDGELVRVGGIGKLTSEIGSIRRGYLLAAILPGVGTLLALPLLRLLVGRSFAGALGYLPILLLLVAVDSLYYTYNHIVYYANRPGLIPVATAAAALVAVAASWLLIPRFGASGALAAKCIASVGRVVAMALAARACLPRAQQQVEPSPPFEGD